MFAIKNECNTTRCRCKYYKKKKMLPSELCPIIAFFGSNLPGLLYFKEWIHLALALFLAKIQIEIFFIFSKINLYVFDSYKGWNRVGNNAYCLSKKGRFDTRLYTRLHVLWWPRRQEEWHLHPDRGSRRVLVRTRYLFNLVWERKLFFLLFGSHVSTDLEKS